MNGSAMRVVFRGLVVLQLACPAVVLAQTTVKYAHTDALGSVVAMTDAAGAIIETKREYEPYGQQLVPVVQDGPGYTGHVQDAATGLVYMQQRYYDPGIGRFLSVDPVKAYSSPVSMFNRYRYANSNPYRFYDPDGRAPCTGTRIGTCVNGATVTGLSSNQLRAVQRNPQAYISSLNEIPNKQSSEADSARYFARTARPVTAVTGREVGADIADVGSGSKPFTVVNFRLGDSGSVEAGQAYVGPGIRTAIAHTHPSNSNFSGAGNAIWDRGWRGSFATSGDMERAQSAGVNAYVALPDGGVLKFDFMKMSSDRTADNVLNALDYITRLP